MRLLAKLLATAKAQAQYFSSGKYEIARENLNSLKVAGTVGLGTCCLFFLIAPLAIPAWHITKEYLLVLPVLAAAGAFALICEARARKDDPVSPLAVELASVLFYVLLLCGFIAISVYPYPATPQIFISLCYMFMPALLILRPAVLLGIMAAAETAFLILAVRYKTTFSVENDIFNTIAALLFSFIIMAITNRLRRRNYETLRALEKLSQTDALTGLLNKNSFEERAAAWLGDPDRGESCALLMLDIDDFKHVNDSRGHPVGDELLSQFGSLLLQAFRRSDLVGRIGGDEFAVLLRGSISEPLIRQKYELLRQRLDSGVTAGAAIHATCSMGAVVCGKQPRSYRELFLAADGALYEAKRSGKAVAVVERLA